MQPGLCLSIPSSTPSEELTNEDRSCNTRSLISFENLLIPEETAAPLLLSSINLIQLKSKSMHYRLPHKPLIPINLFLRDFLAFFTVFSLLTLRPLLEKYTAWSILSIFGQNLPQNFHHESLNNLMTCLVSLHYVNYAVDSWWSSVRFIYRVI